MYNLNMQNDDTMLYKQLFIFSTILFFALGLTLVLSYYKEDFKKAAQNAAAAANEAGKGFKVLMTEDLNQYLDEKKF